MPTRSSRKSGSRAAPLPQPAARPGRDGQHRGRVGAAGAAGRRARRPARRCASASIRARCSRYAAIRAGVGLAAVLAVGEVVPDHRHRAQRAHGQHVDLVQEHGHQDAQDHRDDRHQDGQRPPLLPARRRGQRELRLPGRRQQPRRPVEVQARAVLGGSQRGVRSLVGASSSTDPPARPAGRGASPRARSAGSPVERGARHQPAASTVTCRAGRASRRWPRCAGQAAGS